MILENLINNRMVLQEKRKKIKHLEMLENKEMVKVRMILAIISDKFGTQRYNELLNKKTKIYASTDSSSYIQSRRIHSIGFSSTRAPLGDTLTFKSPVLQVQKDALRRCRSGGCVAPAKKGANQSFLSGR